MRLHRFTNLNGKIILLFITLNIFSCKQFLDVTPKDQISDDAVWTDTGTADLFLNNVYSGIAGPFNTFDPWENFTDNAMNGVNGLASRVLYSPAVYTPNDAPNWWSQYANIRRANVFIEKVTASTLPEDWKKPKIAEARFLRAYFYQLLWTAHGGVPIITNALDQNKEGDGIFRARNTDEETFKFIVDECAAILNDLPLKAEAGRVSKASALTLKGFCELFWASPLKNTTNDKARWATAAATNKQVIDLGSHSLFSNYETQFYEDNNNNVEVIFAKQYLGGTALGSGKEGLWGPWIVGGVQKAYGGVDPTQELVDEYAMANGLPITDPASGYDPQKPYTGREQRFYQSIVYDGSFWTGAEMVMKQGVGSRNATDLSNTNEATNTGYYLRKTLNPKYAVNGNNQLNSGSFIIYRYAEVLLSYAEAQNEAVGPDASVYTAINQIRTRSALPALKAGLTQAEMRVAIQRERRVELAFEERRWFDLIRLKLAEKNLNGTLHAMKIEVVGGKTVYTVIPAPEGGKKFYPEKNYLLPIPQSAINQNTKLVQNPNY
ncbi:RagB/SusD family nutrient uptake outer membrane protein [Dyadobacter luticola]|uniref:RagB/SusD family nutrient uptake outer membrane protein n=1 Tax=Dyadobacter luticola TaxID=1979387 RepID=A0A5R9L5I8_9BACT|nr:RagB/SusD family nutrient uptake outer membrane protein [Dyadobacter luticola]TLV03833.1 RagB/SusD family nutrient uptake outer membrane protein [Dyadobacter luticola]